MGDPDASLAVLYYDTLLGDAKVLRFLAAQVGTGRIMMGSNMPFPIGDLAPAKVIEAAGCSARDVESMTGGLARQL